MRGIHAMERADAVLLVIDASAGVLAQDQHVAGYALEAGKGLVIVVNKIDLVPPIERKPAHWRALLARHFKFAPFAPIVAVSAKTRGDRSDPPGSPGGGRPAPDQDAAQRAEPGAARSFPVAPAAELQGPAPQGRLRDAGGLGGADGRAVRQRHRAAALLVPAVSRTSDPEPLRVDRESAQVGAPGGRCESYLGTRTPQAAHSHPGECGGGNPIHEAAVDVATCGGQGRAVPAAKGSSGGSTPTRWRRQPPPRWGSEVLLAALTLTLRAKRR